MEGGTLGDGKSTLLISAVYVCQVFSYLEMGE